MREGSLQLARSRAQASIMLRDGEPAAQEVIWQHYGRHILPGHADEAAYAHTPARPSSKAGVECGAARTMRVAAKDDDDYFKAASAGQALARAIKVRGMSARRKADFPPIIYLRHDYLLAACTTFYLSLTADG